MKVKSGVAGAGTAAVAWASGVSGTWNTASDWSGGAVPDSADAVSIAALGTFTVLIDAAAAAASLTIDSAHARVEDSGPLALGGDLAIQAGTFSLTHGGELQGGTISLGENGHFLSEGGVAQDLTFDGTLDMSRAHARLFLQGESQFFGVGGIGSGLIDDTGSHSRLYLDRSQTLDHVTIDLGNNTGDSLLQLYGGGSHSQTYTLGSLVQLQQVGKYAVVSLGKGAGSRQNDLINQGTITAGLTGATLYISGGPTDVFSNAGSLVATNGGTILLDANLSVGSLADFSTSSHGVIEIGPSGTLSNEGATLSLSAARQLTVFGTIEGGTIDDAGNGLLISGEGDGDGGTLDDVSYIGTLNLTSVAYAQPPEMGIKGNFSGTAGKTVLNVIASAATVHLVTGATLNDAVINLGGTLESGSDVTFGAGLSIVSAGLDAGITGAATNLGTITASTNGGDLTVSLGSNAGTLIATNGGTLIIVGAISTGALGRFSTGDGGALTLYGTLSNAAATLSLGAGHQMTLAGNGLIDGGVIADTGGGLIADGGYLGDVDYVGTLSLGSANTTLQLENGFSVSSGIVNDTGANANLYLSNTETLNNIQLDLGSNAGTSTLYGFDNGFSGVPKTLTLGSQFYIDQVAGHAVIDLDYSAGGTLISQGTITAGLHGDTLLFQTTVETRDSFINQGTIMATNGDALRVAVDLTNAGTLLVNDGGMAFLGLYDTIGTAALVGNTGTIDVADGQVSIASLVSGSGTIELGAAGTLSLSAGAQSGQVVTFLASTGLLDLAHPLDFTATIAGFTAHDQIDLLNTAETGYSYADGTLTVQNGSTQVAALHFSGNYAQGDFSLVSDGGSGTMITLQG